MNRPLFALALAAWLALTGCGGAPAPVADALAPVKKAGATYVAIQPTPTLVTKQKPTPTPIPALEFASTWEAEQVVQAFQDAGLEYSDPRFLTREDFKHAPYVVDEALEFWTPLFCPDCGGRVFTFSSLKNLKTIKAYLDENGDSYLFIRDNVLVEIGSYTPGDQAKLYEVALKQMPDVAVLATPTPALPLVQAEKDVNLRAGPGTAYEVVGGLSPGQSFNIIGRNADASWWQIAVEDKQAWVAASVVKAVNVDQEIEVAEAPPPPTFTPAPVPTVAPTATIVFVAPPPAPAADAPPAGASAKCGDGTYSFSANRRGTCSHHGGVAIWY